MSATDIDTLARTIYGEARGESDEGKKAVACVVVNRANKKGKSIDTICKQKYQFSCWLDSDPNKSKITSVTTADAVFKKCHEIATSAANGTLPDNTNGATHYHAGAAPSWAKGKTPCATIGHHKFYNDIAW